MSRADWLWFALGVGAIIAAGAATPKVWRGELFGRGVLEREPELFSAWVRILPICVPGSFVFLLLWLFGKLLTVDAERAPTWFAVIAMSYIVVMLLLIGAIMGLNMPKALVPPDRRHEEGLYFKGLQRRLRRSARGRDSQETDEP